MLSHRHFSKTYCRKGGGAPGEQAAGEVGRQMATAEAACRLDAQRCRREPVVSAQHRRGGPLPPSQLSTVQRLARVCIAACLASRWLVSLGTVCEFTIGQFFSAK